MANIIIRNGKEKDATGCISLQKLDNEDFWKLTDFKNSAKNKDVFFLVAEENKKIVGYVLGCINLVKRDEVYLQETRVDNRERGKGIGTKLVEEFCKIASKKGVRNIFSEIENEHCPFYIDRCKFKDRGNHVLIVKEVK